MAKHRIKHRVKRQKSPEQVKKDLDLFAKGVERLKELEEELNSLDTRGFYKEEQAIRSKLKNVSDIPDIEKEIKELRLKIHGKFRHFKKKPGIKKDIIKIKERIPGIERGISRLTRDVEEISKKKKGDVDSVVEALVDRDFTNFLEDIKVKLSEKVKEKERGVSHALKINLKRRERELRRKYSDLVRQYHKKNIELEKQMDEKFKQRLKSELKKKLERDFNKAVNEKLKSKKVELAGEYKRGLREKAQRELDDERERLEESFNNKIRVLGEKEQSDIEKELEKIRREERILEEQKEKEVQELSFKLKRANERIEELRKKRK